MDRDGRINLEEHHAGTNSNDPLPLQLRIERADRGGIHFVFYVRTGSEYALQKKPALDDSPVWETVETINAEGSMGRISVPTGAAREFFRLVQTR